MQPHRETNDAPPLVQALSYIIIHYQPLFLRFCLTTFEHPQPVQICKVGIHDHTWAYDGIRISCVHPHRAASPRKSAKLPTHSPHLASSRLKIAPRLSKVVSKSFNVFHGAFTVAPQKVASRLRPSETSIYQWNSKGGKKW